MLIKVVLIGNTEDYILQNDPLSDLKGQFLPQAA